ncbi:MAG: septum formation initiator family protein [Nitriliruptoraceae bacterium]
MATTSSTARRDTETGRTPPARGARAKRPGGLVRVVTAPVRLVVALFRGDRPYVFAVLGALVVAGLLLMGPAERYLETRARVERLQMTADVLDREVGALEQRVDDLHDPTYIELLAREQQGFVREGEIPYRIVPPAAEQPGVESPEPVPQRAPRWYERAWDAMQRWLGDDGQDGQAPGG